MRSMRASEAVVHLASFVSFMCSRRHVHAREYPAQRGTRATPNSEQAANAVVIGPAKALVHVGCHSSGARQLVRHGHGTYALLAMAEHRFDYVPKHELLRDSRAAALERNLPFTVYVAHGVSEVMEMIRSYRGVREEHGLPAAHWIGVLPWRRIVVGPSVPPLSCATVRSWKTSAIICAPAKWDRKAHHQTRRRRQSHRPCELRCRLLATVSK